MTHDGNFSIADLEQTITADLANTLGNLFNRASVLAQTHSAGHGTVPKVFSPNAQKLLDGASACVCRVSNGHMEQGSLHFASPSGAKLFA